MTERRIVLRAEHHELDSRYLSAYLNANGALVIEGQDLGSGTWPVSADDEYEWFHTIAAADIPVLLELLRAPPGANILDVLSARFTGRQSYELERIIRESGIPVRTWTWSG